MAEPRSVAIVSAVVPYPRDAGKKVVLAGLLDYWRDRVGPDAVHYVLLARSGTVVDGLPAQLHLVERPGTREQLASLFWRTAVTRRHSIQESMLHSRRARDELRATLQAIDADVEIYDTVRLAQYAEELAPRAGQRRVVFLDDLFSVRYSRMLETLRPTDSAPVDPLGQFRGMIPRPLGRVAQSRRVQRALLAIETRLIARREVETARRFSLCLLVNPDEVGTLRRLAGTGHVHSLPPVVEAAAHPRVYDGNPVFVLLGLLSLPHNHDGVMTFLSQCMPEVVERLPDARVLIVGRGALPELLNAAARFPTHVSVEGYVPDLDGLLSRACALIAPLRFGSGIKIKILEAIARGVPVLTTPMGAEGVRNGPDRGVLVEAKLAHHPEAMQRLTDPHFNATLSRAAWQHHASTYSRAAAFRHYDRVFADPAQGSPNPRSRFPPRTRAAPGGAA